jgi:hypothetical protein
MEIAVTERYSGNESVMLLERMSQNETLQMKSLLHHPHLQELGGGSGIQGEADGPVSLEPDLVGDNLAQNKGARAGAPIEGKHVGIARGMEIECPGKR